MSKRETLEEYLARGGEIKKVAPQPTPDNEQKVSPTTSSGGLMTLAEGSIYYADVKPKKPKKKPLVVINFSALPPSLLKYVHSVTKSK